MKQTLLVVLVVAAGCSKGTSQAAPELAAANGPYAAEFPGFDATAIAKKLQGTWVFKGNYDKPFIWQIEGTKVTELDSDGKSTAGELEISSPCGVMLRTADGGGHSYGFVFDGDALHIGLGNSGAIVGNTTYACAFPGLFRKTGDKCEIQDGNKSAKGKLSYMWKTIDCKVDATSFAAKDAFDHDVKLTISNKALFDKDMQGSVATKFASLDEAKAKQAALAKK